MPKKSQINEYSDQTLSEDLLGHNHLALEVAFKD